MSNSEDHDEMPHDVAFHQGLHCLHSQKQYSEKEIQFYLEIITFIFLIHTIIVSSQKEESTSTKELSQRLHRVY